MPAEGQVPVPRNQEITARGVSLGLIRRYLETEYREQGWERTLTALNHGGRQSDHLMPRVSASSILTGAAVVSLQAWWTLLIRVGNSDAKPSKRRGRWQCG